MTCETCNNNYWILSCDSDNNDEIQKCDECNKFKTDNEALIYSKEIK